MSQVGFVVHGLRPGVEMTASSQAVDRLQFYSVYSLYNCSDITFQNTIKESLSLSLSLSLSAYCECLTGVIIQIPIKHILTASIFYIEVFHDKVD